MNNDRLKSIIGFPNFWISASGIVYKDNWNHTKERRALKSFNDLDGYPRVRLIKNGKKYVKTVHRLVANAFIPNPDNKPQVNHINGIKSDNRAENLEWVTPSENIKHSYNTLGKKRNPHFNVYRKWVVRIKDGIIIDKFHGTREASRQTGIRQARISDCCRGLIKHAGGFQWKYIDGDWKDSLMQCGEKK